MDSNNLPTTPPPTYEYVLEEVGVYFQNGKPQSLIYGFGLLQNTRLSQHQRQLSSENSATPNQNSRRSSANSSRQSAAHLSAALELQLNLNDRRNSNSQSISDSDIDSSEICNDPDCQQNYTNSNSCGSRSNNNNHSNINNNDGEQQQGHSQRIIEGVTELQLHSDHEESTLSVNEFLLETEMAAARAKEHNLEGQQLQPCTDEQCTQCGEQAASEEDGEEPSTSNAARQNFYDPLLNRYGNDGESQSSNAAIENSFH